MNAPPREWVTGLDYSYVDQIVRNIRSSLNITKAPLPIKPGPLLSIHLQSNRPDNFTQFLEDLENSLDDPSRIEVVVKIDDTDAVMNELLPKLAAQHSFSVKYISTPLTGGFFGLWRSMNDMLKVCHPDAYFLWNMNDEMAILNKGWDSALAKYVGLFPDHIFRLRTSLFRFRNYYDPWECGFAPETSAITTKRWIDICGDWNPCLGPDSFNQIVSYYFGFHDRFDKDKPLRDVPIHDIVLAGEGAFIGLEGDKFWRRLRGATKSWFRLMSYPMQLEASRRSQKLLAHIHAYEQGLGDFTVYDDTLYKRILLKDGQDRNLAEFSYALSLPAIALTNLWRTTHYFYYGGGGRKIKGQRRISRTLAYLALRYDIFEWIRPVHQWRMARDLTLTRLKSGIREVIGKGARTAFTLIAYTRKASNAQFHKSVFAYDNLQQSLDWPMMQQLLDEVKWSRDFSDKKLHNILLHCLLLKRWYRLSSEEVETALGRDLAFQRFARIRTHSQIPSSRMMDEFQLLLANAGVEEKIYTKADVVLGSRNLPEKPLISNVA